MTSEGLGEMFEGDSADTCATKFPLVLMGGRADGLACADPGARTLIGASGNFITKEDLTTHIEANHKDNYQPLNAKEFVARLQGISNDLVNEKKKHKDICHIAQRFQPGGRDLRGIYIKELWIILRCSGV